jgi:hypothetical protein
LIAKEPVQVHSQVSPGPGVAGAALTEESGAKIDGFTAAVRIGMIALLAAGVGALGLMQSNVLPDLGAAKILRSITGKRGPDLAGLPLLEGDVALSSESVVINGADVDAVRCTSLLPPRALVAAYAELLKDKGFTADGASLRSGAVGGTGSPVPFDGQGSSMLGLRDRNGGFVGIVAFANTVRGGSDYFLVRDAPKEPARDDGSGVPGREPPDVPAPANSTREYCIEKRGEPPSFMVLYRTESTPAIASARMTVQMEEAGWTEPAAAKEALAGAGDSHPRMFLKDSAQVLLSIAPADQGTGAWITVVYRRNLRN